MTTPDPRIVAAFAPHRVPAPFQTTEHFAFVSDDGLYPCGDCCIAEPGDLVAWLGEEAAARAVGRLHVFLRGPAGYLYGFWSHDGRPMRDAPIVYLDDEGDGSAVVAENLGEFLGIIANGFDRIRLDALEPSPDALPASPEAFFTHRGIAALPDWEARIRAAAARHPDFAGWLDALLG